jgi:hypothetical protein
MAGALPRPPWWQEQQSRSNLAGSPTRTARGLCAETSQLSFSGGSWAAAPTGLLHCLLTGSAGRAIASLLSLQVPSGTKQSAVHQGGDRFPGMPVCPVRRHRGRRAALAMTDFAAAVAAPSQVFDNPPRCGRIGWRSYAPYGGSRQAFGSGSRSVRLLGGGAMTLPLGQEEGNELQDQGVCDPTGIAPGSDSVRWWGHARTDYSTRTQRYNGTGGYVPAQRAA